MDFSLRPITKIEEQRAFQYIKDVLVPRVVQIYNTNPKTERKITADEIRKVLKKTAEIPATSNQKGPYARGPIIEYFARLQEPNSNLSYVFGFTIKRTGKYSKRPDRIIVHCTFPISAMCGAYLQESFERRPSSISKIEEERAFQFIKQKVVPQAVIDYNTRVFPKDRTSVEQLNKLIRKVKSEPDSISYEANIGPENNWKFEFIVKKSESSFTIHYITPMTIKQRVDFLQETIERKPSITKIEEYCGLQFIRERIIPIAAKRWNKCVEKSRLKNKEMYMVSPEEISKSLVKKVHYIHTPEDRIGKDWIQYESTPIKPFTFKGPFRFTLKKDNFVWELSVSVSLPGSVDSYEYHIEEKDREPVLTNPIRRGINIKESIEKSDPLDIHHFSKREEGECVQFIKQTVLPYLVARKNKQLSARYKKPSILNVDEVRRNFRKVESLPTKHGLILTYTAEGQGQKYDISLFKDGEGDILVWNRPFSEYWPVGKPIKPSVEDDFTEAYHINEVTRGPREITKIEEAELLQNLRNRVIPVTTFIWNQVVKHQHKWKNYGITTEKISKNLVKYEHGIHAANDLTTTDVIRYKSIIWPQSNLGFTFECYKQVNNSNKIIVMIGFPDNSTKNVSPYGALREGVNFTESPDETGLKRISPKEEKEALQYIRQYMVPRAVKYHNDAGTRVNQVSEEELQRNLRLFGRYPQHGPGNPSISFVSIPRGIYFSFMVHKQFQDLPDKGKLYVRFGIPGAFSPHEYYVGITPKPLYEAIKVKHAAGPRVITKKEENEALQYIRNTLIPAAFKCYNNHVIGDFRVKHEDDIRKAVKKIDVEYTPDDQYETILYWASVPTIGGKKIQNFKFWIRKNNTPGFKHRIRCGAAIEGHVGQEFYIGEPAYIT